jgi:molybdopterin/thiamine biosynthesis adenylyltransferase
MKDITILGAGALGSNITKLLVPDLKGAYRISVMDFDIVEERNVQVGTQFYTEDQIGQKKVEALQYNLYKWFNREINIIPERLTEDNLPPVLASQHLIIDCFDNHKSRKMVQDFCKKIQNPLPACWLLS